jgi:RNA polymerase sigma-70 factor (ECF subfamily)
LSEASGGTETDFELLQRVRRGEPEGAESLFERYSAAILRFTDRLLGNRADAEEVTQDVFVKMISRVEQHDGKSAVASWLFAIAANACRDRLRRGRRAPGVPLELVAEPASSDERVDGRLIRRERRRIVRGALAQLSLEQREALVLARYHEMPYSEIAKALDISEGAVKTRIFRAMEALKSRFAEGGSQWNAVKP